MFIYVEIKIVTDNVGTAAGFGSGSSTCPFAHTAIKSLHDVAMALNVKLTVCWRRRRTDEMSMLVDELSKSDTARVMEYDNPVPGYMSRTLVNYMSNPRPERCLGTAISVELASWMETLDCHVEWQDSFRHLVRYPKRKFSE